MRSDSGRFEGDRKIISLCVTVTLTICKRASQFKYLTGITLTEDMRSSIDSSSSEEILKTIQFYVS